MLNSILVTAGLALVGEIVAAPVMNAFGMKEAEGFGLDDVVEGVVIGIVIVFGRRTLKL